MSGTYIGTSVPTHAESAIFSGFSQRNLHLIREVPRPWWHRRLCHQAAGAPCPGSPFSTFWSWHRSQVTFWNTFCRTQHDNYWSSQFWIMIHVLCSKLKVKDMEWPQRIGIPDWFFMFCSSAPPTSCRIFSFHQDKQEFHQKNVYSEDMKHGKWETPANDRFNQTITSIFIGNEFYCYLLSLTTPLQCNHQTWGCFDHQPGWPAQAWILLEQILCALECGKHIYRNQIT